MLVRQFRMLVPKARTDERAFRTLVRKLRTVERTFRTTVFVLQLFDFQCYFKEL